MTTGEKQHRRKLFVYTPGSTALADDEVGLGEFLLPGGSLETPPLLALRQAYQRIASVLHEEGLKRAKPLVSSAATSETFLLPVFEKFSASTIPTSAQIGLPIGELFRSRETEQKIRLLEGLDIWTDDDRGVLNELLDEILTDQYSSYFNSLKSKLVESPKKIFVWECLDSLGRLVDPRATELETTIREKLISSGSAGDRAAAIRSLWRREEQSARSRLRALRKNEKNRFVLALLDTYLDGGSDGKEVSKAA